ncbi:MAG: ABC transporter permease [Candidatus Aminicenantia bacterium]
MKKRLIELIRYRALIQSLVSRELKARYRGSFLGFLWSFLNPFLLLCVYTIVFGLILRPRDPSFPTPLSYALFLFTGLLPWIWFSSSILESSNVLMVNSGLIKKIMFPAEILPIAVVTTNLVNFVLGLPILFFFYLIFGHKFTLWFLFLPLCIITQLIFTLGLSLIVAPFSVLFKDLQNIIANVITLWFFSTPIIYPFSFPAIQKSPLLKLYLLLNPMTHVIESYHYSLFYGSLPHWKKISVTFIISLILFLIGYAIFDKLRDTVTEEV